MPDPIRCITCGAVSFASPKAALHCHTCYEKLQAEIACLREQMVALYGKLEHLEGELRRAEEADDG